MQSFFSFLKWYENTGYSAPLNTTLKEKENSNSQTS